MSLIPIQHLERSFSVRSGRGMYGQRSNGEVEHQTSYRPRSNVAHVGVERQGGTAIEQLPVLD